MVLSDLHTKFSSCQEETVNSVSECCISERQNGPWHVLEERIPERASWSEGHKTNKWWWREGKVAVRNED